MVTRALEANLEDDRSDSQLVDEGDHGKYVDQHTMLTAVAVAAPCGPRLIVSSSQVNVSRPRHLVFCSLRRLGQRTDRSVNILEKAPGPCPSAGTRGSACGDDLQEIALPSVV
jgi:hypothetical protein